MNALDSDMYKRQSYWNERYAEEESYDWFCDISAFKHLFCRDVKAGDRILVLGSGNSTLSGKLYQHGYTHIDNIDFSPVVTQKMSERMRRMSGMRWHTMDMLELGFEDGSFDAVVDKGSIDVLMVDQGSVWSPKEEVVKTTEKALMEASRVLRPGGHFVSVTFSQPHFRGKMLAQENKFGWSVRHWTFGDHFHYFYYRATKGGSQDPQYDYSYPELYDRASTCSQQQEFISPDLGEQFLSSIEADVFQ